MGVVQRDEQDFVARRSRGEPAATGAETVFVANKFAHDPAAGFGPTGEITITLVNEGAIFHNLLIEEVRGFVLDADSGVTSSTQVELDEGVYTIFCSVPGHRDAGMEGTLAISPS